VDRCSALTSYSRAKTHSLVNRHGRQAILAVVLSLAALVCADAAESPDESDCLALTMYHEARGGGREAMIAIGWVVLNRRDDPAYPGSICEVVRAGGEEAPCQFSYWCDGRPDRPQNEKLWRLAKETARAMLQDPPKDPTGGALYFHSAEMAIPWKRHRERTVRIGNHIFYR
jgi:N-acetylmuramoyl-L-alanine amidase